MKKKWKCLTAALPLFAGFCASPAALAAESAFADAPAGSYDAAQQLIDDGVVTG